MLPSEWVSRFASLVPATAAVLDLACGGGRHGRMFLEKGYRVVFLDRQTQDVADLSGQAEVITTDLEDGSGWPLQGRAFAGIVVTNYLHRPLFPHVLENLMPGGVLIYETFAAGNEAFGRPRNPDHLLQAGELLSVAIAGGLHIVAYEHGLENRTSAPRMIQRLCAVRPPLGSSVAIGFALNTSQTRI